nr:M23 family peptidase [Pseudomonadota bacterium]
MTMGARVRSQSPGIYLQPARLRANIEFGVDPAIEADGARHASFDRRRVSLRWLSATLLTGLTGAALIGSAIYAALGHQTYFAEAPAPSLSQRKEINLDFGVNPH